MPMAGAPGAARSASSLLLTKRTWARYGRGAGEIWARCRRDTGEVQARYGRGAGEIRARCRRDMGVELAVDEAHRPVEEARGDRYLPISPYLCAPLYPPPISAAAHRPVEEARVDGLGQRVARVHAPGPGPGVGCRCRGVGCGWGVGCGVRRAGCRAQGAGCGRTSAARAARGRSPSRPRAT